MVKYLPELILDMYKARQDYKKIRGAILVIDIVGFTNITESLIELGKEGSEILSEIINQIFKPAIEIVSLNYGDILTFAGDSFTVLFPESSPEKILSTAIEIRNLFKNFKINTNHKKFLISSRQGLAYGTVECHLLHAEKYHQYFIHGKCIRDCIRAEKRCQSGDLIIHSTFRNKLLVKPQQKIGRGFYKIDSFNLEKRGREIKLFQTGEEGYKDFIPRTILEQKHHGEFRNVVSLFICFKDFQTLLNHAAEIMNKTYIYKGYFNKADYGDKGSLIVIVFGAPSAEENTIKRAIDLGIEIKENLRSKVKMGITYGEVYAGLLGSELRGEYTVLGRTVNLASRLMENCPWNEICIDKNIFKISSSIYEYKLMGMTKLKGIKYEEQIYFVVRKHQRQKRLYTGEMFGREKEFKQLYNELENLDQVGFNKIIYISGLPGVGKSRLINDFRINLDRKKVQWIYMPSDKVLRTSFNPVINYLRFLFNQDSNISIQKNKKFFEKKFISLTEEITEPVLKENIIKAKSYIANLLNIQYEKSGFEYLNSKLKFENSLYALKDFFLGLVSIKPSIIELEDGQWIDSDSLEFLKILTRNLKSHQCLILSSCRLRDNGEDYIIPIPDLDYIMIRLGNLNKPQVAQVIEEKLGKPGKKDLISLIFEKTSGNPFFLEQFISYLRERGHLDLINNKYKIEKQDVEIPNKISEVIISRIDRLSHNFKKIIKTASILGQEFSVNILKHMLKGEDITERLIQLEHEGIWYTFTELSYIFQHAIIRDVVYEMQLKKHLKRLHKIAGELIEEVYANNLDTHLQELAYHFYNTNDKKKAKHYLNKAGELSKKNYQNEDALKNYLKVKKFMKTPKEKIEVNRKLAELHQITGRWTKAKKLLKENLKIIKKLKDKKSKIMCNSEYGVFLWRIGNYKQALKILLENYREAKKAKYKELMSHCSCNIGLIYKALGNREKALEFFNIDLEISKQLNDEQGMSYTIGNIGTIYGQGGELDKAFDCFKQVEKVAKKINDKFSLSMTYGSLGIVFMGQKKFKAALNYFKKQYKIAEEIQDRFLMSYALGNLGSVNLNLGNRNQAIEFLKQKLDIAQEMGDQRGEAIAFGNMGELFWKEKSYSRADTYLQRAVSIAEKINLKLYLCEFMVVYTENKVEQGDIKNAKKLFIKTAKLLNETQIPRLSEKLKILEQKINHQKKEK